MCEVLDTVSNHEVIVCLLPARPTLFSGGSRNLERGVESPAREARRKIFWVATPKKKKLGCHAHFRSRERVHTKNKI